MERVLDDSRTGSPTPELEGYCNYRCCDGEVQGGEWCNLNYMHCTTDCEGTWCIRQLTSSTPTRLLTTPTCPPAKPSPFPIFGPSLRPTMATEEPSLSPTLQPTPCQDDPIAEFFLRIKLDVEPEKAVYKTCDWLVSTRSDDQRTSICSRKTHSYGGYEPARDVCKVAYDTCYLTHDSSASPSETMTKSLSLSPTKKPSKAPTEPPTEFLPPHQLVAVHAVLKISVHAQMFQTGVMYPKETFRLAGE